MSAWKFIGITEAEYDKIYFHKRPIRIKCAYPKCSKKHAKGKHFCPTHFAQLQSYLTKSISVQEKTEAPK
jgi:hypothetical protein